MRVYAVTQEDDLLAIDVFVREEDAEALIAEVRGDEPELAGGMRVEPVELEA